MGPLWAVAHHIQGAWPSLWYPVFANQLKTLQQCSAATILGTNQPPVKKVSSSSLSLKLTPAEGSSWFAWVPLLAVSIAHAAACPCMPSLSLLLADTP